MYNLRRSIIAILDNVTFAFVKIQKPVKGLNEGDTEFTVDTIVSKADAKQWNTDHPKNKAKAVDTEEFEGKYKFEPPYPDQDSQYVIKFKKIHSKKGVELPAEFRPRVFLAEKGEKPTDITFETLVANGSTGKVSWSTFEGPAKFPGTFVQLNSILVEDLIPYETSGGGAAVKPGDDFGVTELAAAPKNQKPVNKQTDDEDDEPAPVAKKPKKPSKPAAEFDDDIPF